MTHPNTVPLEGVLVDRVLEGLGLAARPEPGFDGLALVYGAWCERVPFDNLRKLIHVSGGEAGPLAGDDVREFLEAWLRWGTGGTCWAGNGALCMLLSALGFDAVRGVATMMAAPDIPPNHGTVVVRVDGRRWLCDASMLHGEPLLLDVDRETTIAHPARGLSCAMRDGRWHVRWRPLHQAGGFDCRIEKLESDAVEFSERHEATRGWSPFNYEANARRNVGDRVVGLAFGQRVELRPDGSVDARPVDAAGRLRVLVEEVGIAPELAERVPPDRPTPPPPGSATAASTGR